MTILKLANLIVEEYFDGSPGSERAQYEIGKVRQELANDIYYDEDGKKYVSVKVED